jgi:tagatose kinase
MLDPPTPTILSLGELLVEVMREDIGVPLSDQGRFVGPYASGAPAIFAHTAAQLGASVGFVGVCGNDVFGFTCVNKLQQAGVNISHIRTSNGYQTGTAFVSYKHDGSRQFFFHLRHSAAALLNEQDIDPLWFNHCRWLHITGSSLALSDSAKQAVHLAIKRAKKAGATISFDPNLRLELMPLADIQRLCEPMLDLADMIMPSGREAALMLGMTELLDSDDETAARALLRRGVKMVVLKQGAKGCRVFTEDGTQHIPSILVNEVDPTGAGDAFAAGFALARLEGLPLDISARFANVTGALSVTTRGLMEAAITRAEVESYL